ncbi:MAG TPA: anti-sigma factor [Sphingomicrobium sp.]|nr:anti-sigma factor [Sphingomicrobium sp.]
MDEMIEDEKFYAWLDGELEGQEAELITAEVAADPVLAARAERHRTLGASLRDAFAPVMAAEVALPTFAAEVVAFGARKTELQSRCGSFGVPQWAAMAATLAIGIVAGQFIDDGSGAPIERRDGILVAAEALDRSLDAQLASAGMAAPVRVGLTFRNRDGAICRSFSGEAVSGLACRAGENWQIDGLFGGSAQRGDYRMATGENPRLVALIEETIAGEPFDAAQEKRAQARGWR